MTPITIPWLYIADVLLVYGLIGLAVALALELGMFHFGPETTNYFREAPTPDWCLYAAAGIIWPALIVLVVGGEIRWGSGD